jgi:hypothetical protein
MKQIILGSLLFLMMACNSSSTSNSSNPIEETNSKLKAAMSNYLNTDPNAVNKFQYEVDSVAFFDDKQAYICEFHVRMKSLPNAAIGAKAIDTTGAMKVRIDKNFKVISRYY